jgi:short-chain 2-methylacyl-CoA dehydrogenase
MRTAADRFSRRDCGSLVPAVQFELTDERRLLQETAREFVRQEVAPRVAELDRAAAFPYEAVAKLGELGLMGIPFPEEYGGSGADMLSLALVIEELARIDCALAITVSAHTSLGTMPIHLWGTDEQKSEWLPQLCSGRRLAAFGLTEPEAGTDAGNTQTTARLEDGEWVVNGTKVFITNPGTEISGCVTITALTGEPGGRREISNIIVPNGTPGYEVGPPYRKMGWRSSDTRPLTFEDCRVPESNLLGRRGGGFRQFMKVLEGGRIGVAAMGVGLAQGALDEALAYAKQRRAFGQPLSKFQSIQAKLADISAQLEAARLLTYRAAVKADRGELHLLAAAQAKLVAGRLAVRATEEAVQIHGGYGFIEDYPVCRFYRDAKILTIGEGTDEAQQMVIAQQLGC